MQPGERELHLRLNAGDPDDPTPRRPLGDVLQQRRLADSCLAAHHEHRALPCPDALQLAVQHVALVMSASQHLAHQARADRPAPAREGLSPPVHVELTCGTPARRLGNQTPTRDPTRHLPGRERARSRGTSRHEHHRATTHPRAAPIGDPTSHRLAAAGLRFARPPDLGRSVRPNGTADRGPSLLRTTHHLRAGPVVAPGAPADRAVRADLHAPARYGSSGVPAGRMRSRDREPLSADTASPRARPGPRKAARTSPPVPETPGQLRPTRLTTTERLVMKIVVIGGTGLIGSKLVGKLDERGHDAVPAAPNTGVNTITGEGLSEVLEGAQVVVDVSNSPDWDDEAVMQFFQTSSRNLLAAEAAAGVGHHVALSVVGTDRLTESGYFRAKLAQEELIEGSSIPYSIVHATQFFEFMNGIADQATDGNAVRLPPVLIQPMAADDVASAVARVAIAPPMSGIAEIAGPEQFRLAELIRGALTARNDPREVITDPHAPYYGIAVSQRTLLPGDDAQIGNTRFDDWLRNAQAPVTEDSHA